MNIRWHVKSSVPVNSTSVLKLFFLRALFFLAVLCLYSIISLTSDSTLRNQLNLLISWFLEFQYQPFSRGWCRNCIAFLKNQVGKWFFPLPLCNWDNYFLQLLRWLSLRSVWKTAQCPVRDKGVQFVIKIAVSGHMSSVGRGQWGMWNWEAVQVFPCCEFWKTISLDREWAEKRGDGGSLLCPTPSFQSLFPP